jgi:hypothetical protein
MALILVPFPGSLEARIRRATDADVNYLAKQAVSVFIPASSG